MLAGLYDGSCSGCSGFVDGIYCWSTFGGVADRPMLPGSRIDLSVTYLRDIASKIWKIVHDKRPTIFGKIRVP